jgi:hypothetical protein
MGKAGFARNHFLEGHHSFIAPGLESRQAKNGNGLIF